MKNIDLARHLPCGFPVKMEKNILAGILGSAIGLTLPLLVRMENAKNDLYTYRGTRKVLIEGAVMVDFIDLVEYAFLGFFLAIVLALAFGFYHYAFHHQGSKSIYLMRRLPNGFELHRRCWTVPVAAALIITAVMMAMFLLYFGLYFIITPDACLAPHQWQKIWSVIL